MENRLKYWIEQLKEENPLLVDDLEHWLKIVQRIKYIL